MPARSALNTIRYLLMAATAITLQACGGGGGGGSDPAPPAAPGWQAASVSKTFTALDPASDTTLNPLRGYYRWRNQEQVPQAAPALDAYNRYTWRALETGPGVYDFSKVLSDLQTAKSQGRKFALRVQAMLGYDNDTRYLPDYLVGNSACVSACGWWADHSASTPGLSFIPDWNDPYLQQRARLLLLALAQAIGSDEDIAWIDIGVYGQYGEWALSSAIDYAKAPAGIVAPSDASKREFVRMHLDAFPARQLVMFAVYRNFDAIRYATQEQTLTSKPVGLRIDCLGRANFMDQWINHPAEWSVLQNQWQRAPFVAEFCTFGSGDAANNASAALQQLRDFHISTVGNGNLNPWANFTSADQQILQQIGREAGYRYRPVTSTVTLSTAGALKVSTLINNDGNAPSYEPWAVGVELTDGGGQRLWSGVFTGKLGDSLGNGSSQTLAGEWQLPALAAGSYTLNLIARDARSGQASTLRPPLRWHVSGQAADGSLVLATLSRN